MGAAAFGSENSNCQVDLVSREPQRDRNTGCEPHGENITDIHQGAFMQGIHLPGSCVL